MIKSTDDKYLIEVPEEEVESIARLLREAGITMRPRYPEREEIVAVRHTSMGNFNYTESDLRQMVKRTNLQLEADGLTPAIPDLESSWSRERCQTLLEVLLEKLRCEEDGASTQKDWSRITGQHPTLFG